MFGILNRIADNYKQAYISIVCGILAFIQCFFTCDPVTTAVFLKLNLGNSAIIYVGDTTKDMMYGDYLVYNTQYIMINKSIDEVLKRTGYNPQEYDAVVSDNNGACITGNSAVFLYNWDMKKHKRVFYENDNTIAMPETLQVRSLPLYDLKEKAVLIYLPYNGNVTKEDMLESANEYYEVGEDQEVQTVQGCIYYYDMTLRE